MHVSEKCSLIVTFYHTLYIHTVTMINNSIVYTVACYIAIMRKIYTKYTTQVTKVTFTRYNPAQDGVKAFINIPNLGKRYCSFKDHTT